MVVWLYSTQWHVNDKVRTKIIFWTKITDCKHTLWTLCTLSFFIHYLLTLSSIKSVSLEGASVKFIQFQVVMFMLCSLCVSLVSYKNENYLQNENRITTKIFLANRIKIWNYPQNENITDGILCFWTHRPIWWWWWWRWCFHRMRTYRPTHFEYLISTISWFFVWWSRKLQVNDL